MFSKVVELPERQVGFYLRGFKKISTTIKELKECPQISVHLFYQTVLRKQFELNISKVPKVYDSITWELINCRSQFSHLNILRNNKEH
jgi:hypothetical protein